MVRTIFLVLALFTAVWAVDQVDGRNGLDPNGATTNSDGGAGLDPDGAASDSDGRNGLDPDG